MSTSAGRLRFLPGWLRYAGVWVVLMLVCGPQTYWSGAGKSWPEVAWIQVSYWTTWAILTPGIFWLCQRLYEGPRIARRYIPGLLLGLVGVAILHPIIENSFHALKGWIAWTLAMQPDRPTGFIANVGSAIMRGSGTNPFMFAVIALFWHARRSADDLRTRQMKSLELEARLREAQLHALRSQLNPHFLFNTLHSIAELVHRDPHLAEELILRLGELLRKALASSGRQEIALSEELEFIQAYLDIERMRLGDRLKLDWNVADEVLGVPVPSLLLQPLVENAIQHGIASSSGPGQLSIRARREGDFLDLQVRDSGPGLPPEGESTGPGIGLANTAARLKTIYGERHQFELINRDGFTVNVRLPIPAPA